MSISDPKLALASWREEKGSAFLYRHLAISEKETPREAVFQHLADEAETQAKIWAQALLESNVPLPPYRPSFRLKLIAWLIPRLDPRALRTILVAMKVRGLSASLGEIHETHERRHWTIKTGGAIRAAVFGVNDGLVSNVSLILGFAGASSNTSIIVLSGIAGLFAGALSMGAGEYISMRSQRELFEYQIALEGAELEAYPEEEAAELSYIYQARGLSKMDADAFAQKMLSNKTHALNVLAREKLGLNPDELGSPWGAAISSFFSFSIGAFVPLLPFLFNIGKFSLSISILLTGLALFTVGVTLSLFTGNSALYSGFRMLMIGLLAGAATFGIGRAVGVTIS